ncbi:hypothetical protein CEXT_179071 [Caerostris extrusa]|uniref:Uncharacterized protein n=1 Tax=Caerostris extrusa TaxID=172846 RepID=A0AAV4RYI8_CAEEX|nr:hypothetical protein CEXT_179071 [Caerostris extrusa]
MGIERATENEKGLGERKMSREIGHWMVVKGRGETRNGANRSLSVLLQLIRGLERDASEDRYLGHEEWTAPNPSDKSGLCCQKLG